MVSCRTCCTHSFSITCEQTGINTMFLKRSNTFRTIAFIWRLCAFTYLSIWLLTGILWEQVSLKFYTVQSFFWVYIYFTFAVSYGRQKTTNSELPLFEDEQKLNERDYFTYVIGILGIAGGGTAMAGFWIFLFGYFKHLGLSGWFIFWFCFTPHGMSFIFILIDQVIFSRTQYKIAHCLIPFAMIFLYLGFAMLHYSIKKKYIYPFLEVSKGNYWIAWIVLAIFPSVLVAIVWLLQIIRGKIVKST